jgi:hypothetical protein
MVTGASAGPRANAGSMVTLLVSAAQAAQQKSVAHRVDTSNGL